MRIRVTFSKTGPLRYISNLDLYTLWERAARRARLPLAYSQGFHPQPKIHFAAPLPLGYSSTCEVMDMRLSEDIKLDNLGDQLNAVMPTGVQILDVKSVEEAAPALQTQVVSADYQVELQDGVDSQALASRIQELQAATTLPRERRGRKYDLRPLIEELRLEGPVGGDAFLLKMRLRSQEGATGRPDEVLAELGIRLEAARIERTALRFRAQGE